MKKGWPNIIVGAIGVIGASWLTFVSTSENDEHVVARKYINYALQDYDLNAKKYPAQTLDRIRQELSDEKLANNRYINEETRKLRQELETYCEKAKTNAEEVKFAEKAMLARAEQVIGKNYLDNPAYLGISAAGAGLAGLGSILIGTIKRRKSQTNSSL